MGAFMPVVLTRSQFVQVVNCAAPLYPADRDQFISEVAAQLERVWPIDDGSVHRAIAVVQGRYQHPEPEPVSTSRWSRERPRFERQSKRAY
jgi:hypothetical protein